MSDILDPQTTAEAPTAAPVETAPEAETVAPEPVSYTHLTLPTIYSV